MQAKELVGRRIEIPVHYNAWMQGARYGLVTSIGRNGSFVYVKLDRRPKPRLSLWRLDFDYVKFI
jgi:hypothetical protein